MAGDIEVGVEVIPTHSVAFIPDCRGGGGLTVQAPTLWDFTLLTVITHKQQLLTTQPIDLTDGGGAWSAPD